MRKVIVGAFVSMDGVMQAPGGPDEYSKILRAQIETMGRLVRDAGLRGK